QRPRTTAGSASKMPKSSAFVVRRHQVRSAPSESAASVGDVQAFSRMILLGMWCYLSRAASAGSPLAARLHPSWRCGSGWSRPPRRTGRAILPGRPEPGLDEGLEVLGPHEDATAERDRWQPALANP